MEKRQRRTARPLSTRRPVPPRLRYLQTHPPPLRRRTQLSRHLALPLAPPPRRTRLHRRSMGRKIRAAPPPLLQPHPARPQAASFQTTKLEGFRRPHQPNHRNRSCLTGSTSFAIASNPCASPPPPNPASSRNSR